MSVGTRLALSGFAAVAAAAALTALSEGTAAAEVAAAPMPAPDGGAPVALHGQFAGTPPGPAEFAPPTPPALLAASSAVPAPVTLAPLADPEPGEFAPAAPEPLAVPAVDTFDHADTQAAPLHGDPERPVVLVPVAADSTTVPTLLSASVPAASLPGQRPEAVPGAVVVPDAIPGPAPSRAVVLTPGPAPAAAGRQVHPRVAQAAVDKSAIIYDAHPVDKVTDADIHAGLVSAGVGDGVIGRFVEATRVIIGGESGGMTNAVNRWDSNATGASQADGAPGNSSRGLMQTVPGTFAAHHAPGTSLSIYDPHANIAAAWRYITSRYSVDLATGRGLDSFMARGVGRGVGY